MHPTEKTGLSGPKSASSSSRSFINKTKTEDKPKDDPLNKMLENKKVINEKQINKEKEKTNETNNFNLNNNYYLQNFNKNDFYYNPKFYKNQEKIKGIYGFKNNKLANNCFINSSLQNLFHCNFFLKSMNSISDKRIEGKKLANEIKRLSKEIYDGKDDLESKKIKQILSEAIEKYKYDEQNDANEFIIIFLNQLLKELNEIGKYEPGLIPTNQMELDAFNKLEKNFFLKNKCFLLNFFYGRIEKEYCCEKGHLCLVKFNNFSSLTLPKSNKSSTIEELLNLYQTNKQIEDTILCKECQKVCKYSIKTKIYNIPKYFILSLEKDDTHYSSDIIDSRIIETKNFMEGINKKYYLTSLVSYSGNKKAGHYIAKVLQDNEWCLINDSHYWKIDASEILDKYAKILFYTIEDLY